jgi:hypothetical protein
MPKAGVLGSRYVYPQRGLIGAYPANEGTGTTLTDYSPLLGYRNSGTNTGRCGNLSITLGGGSGTAAFAWNPAPESIANRPLRNGVSGINTDIGFRLGGTNNYGSSASGTNDYISVPCGGNVKTAVFIIRASHDTNASGNSAPEGNGECIPLLGGDGADNSIGFRFSGKFGAPLYRTSQNDGNTKLDWQSYWDNSDSSQNLHCVGDDVVLVLTNPGSSLTKMYCNGVEVPYKAGLATMTKLWAGTSNWYIGREDYAVFGNFRYNQPMIRNIQWMSFHSVALTPLEIQQATMALRHKQRKKAMQPPLLIGIVGDSISDECFGTIGTSAGNCPTTNSPNGTTISGAMDATQTSITFASNPVISYDSSLGTGGYIRVSRTEYMKIVSCSTATGATSCTVQRGCLRNACSGTGVTHSSGDFVQTSWAIQLRAALQNSAVIVNAAMSFFDDLTMRQEGMTVAGPRYYEGTNIKAEFDKAQSGIYGRKVLIGTECINGLNGGRTPAQMEQNLTQWANDHKQAGYAVFWITCSPQGDQLASTSGGTLPGGSKEPNRQALNTWARGNGTQNAVTISGTGFSGPGLKDLIDLEVDSVFSSGSLREQHQQFAVSSVQHVLKPNDPVQRQHVAPDKRWLLQNDGYCVGETTG